MRLVEVPLHSWKKTVVLRGEIAEHAARGHVTASPGDISESTPRGDMSQHDARGHVTARPRDM